VTQIELDCRGQLCPLPIIALAEAFGDVAVGETIDVVADDPAAAVDVPAWCRMKGQAFDGEDVAEDGTPRFRVRRVV
jgi:tRNA 2-thiouridine synthesizing protein A